MFLVGVFVVVIVIAAAFLNVSKIIFLIIIKINNKYKYMIIHIKFSVLYFKFNIFNYSFHVYMNAFWTSFFHHHHQYFFQPFKIHLERLLAKNVPHKFINTATAIHYTITPSSNPPQAT